MNKRKAGAKPKKSSPLDIYNRNRQRYYYSFKKNKITLKEYNHLMDKNLEEYEINKKNPNSSLLDFNK